MAPTRPGRDGGSIRVAVDILKVRVGGGAGAFAATGYHGGGVGAGVYAVDLFDFFEHDVVDDGGLHDAGAGCDWSRLRDGIAETLGPPGGRLETGVHSGANFGFGFLYIAWLSASSMIPMRVEKEKEGEGVEEYIQQERRTTK